MESLKLKEEFTKLGPEQRLYNLNKPLIGLTGGIGTGKSAVSSSLISMGYPLVDADKLIKDIYAQQESIQFIKDLSQDLVHNNEINFKNLRKLFFENSDIKQQVETFIFQRLEKQFHKECEKYKNHKFIIYDAPILFEKKIEVFMDLTLLVYASKEEQIKRVMQRDSISEELAKKIIQQQISIEEKKKKADFIIDNSKDLPSLNIEIKNVLEKIFS